MNSGSEQTRHQAVNAQPSELDIVAGDAAVRGAAAFSVGYRRYALGVMTAVWMMNLVDRGLMVLLLQPIKDELSLSDTQLGFLTGVAFGLFYAALGVPLARWADRGDRVTIAALSIGLWGVTVMASLFVSNYLQLVMARIAAAVGEAGCKPPTYSLVGDYFPGAAERTRAMGIYWLGSPLSALVSFMLGGWLNDHYGWRFTFFLLGIPGVVLAVLVRLTVKEPRMLAAAQANSPVVCGRSMASVLSTLWRQPSSRNLSIALIVLYSMGQGFAPWYGAFMIRSHGMNTGELGTWLGCIFSLGGVVGVFLGGYLTSRLFPDNERSQMRMIAVTVAALVPGFAVFLLVPEKHSALAAMVPLIVVCNFFLAPTYALMQRLVPEDMRATTMSVVMLLANLIGMGVASQAIGLASDLLRPVEGVDSLRYAMLLLSFIALWAAYYFWQVGQTVAYDLQRLTSAARENQLFSSQCKTPSSTSIVR